MAKKSSFSLSEYFFKHRILLLLATILGFIIGSPFTDEIFQHGMIPDLLLSIIFIFGIYAISRKKKHIYIAIALATPMVLGVWGSHLSKNVEFFIVGEFFGSLFTAFIISQLLLFIFHQKEITKEVIYAAVVVYLMMAIMWALVYLILDYFYPDSFSFPTDLTPNLFRYLYFSFVTITTLGYGDVAPLTHKAGSLVILEAVTGQIYLVVIVAWLVGMHVSRKSQ